MANKSKRLSKYKEAIGSAKTKAHTAIQRAEDAHFAASDRLARRSQEQAAVRQRNGLGGR